MVPVMDDILTFADESPHPGSPQEVPWKILIADDDPSVHLVTKLALGNFTFEGKPLELLGAFGEEDTRHLMERNPDIAVILLDVVMDDADSGFSLVRYIRETLQNKDVRIIMRTGQSGNAPEDRIIISYDINDFKDKTELTVAKLRTTLISSLRTYNHLKIIAEEQRKSLANRTYLHTIIDSLSSVLITLDLDLRVLLWNREAERWTGLSAEAMAGRNLFDAAPVFEPLKALFQELRGPSSSGRVEKASVPLWKGSQVFVHLILQTLEGSSGTEILFRLDDRTVAQRQNEQFLRSQKVNAFSTLAAGVAGELAEVLRSEESDTVDRIRAWGRRASGLLDRLVQFSPLALPERDPQDWATVLRHRVESAVVPAGVSLSLKVITEPAWVGTHPGGLETMVDNLIENALDAMTSAPGAELLQGPKVVHLELDRGQFPDPDGLKQPRLGDGTAWVLTVRDHGVGMSPEVVRQVFDPYFTTKPGGQGLGLGLPLVYSLVEGLGGFVSLSSKVGAGTEVKVYLPAWTAHGRSSESDSVGILVCEDDPLLRQVTTQILRNNGYDVFEATDGTTALEVYRAEKERIRLVILDVVLPGLSGMEVLRFLHTADSRLPVLLSSGFGRGEHVDSVLKDVGTGFLKKPYRAEELLQAVQETLHP